MLTLWLRRTSEIRRQAREIRELEEYAEGLKAEIEQLKARLDAERLRHQEREERLIDRVLVTRQTYGISEAPERGQAAVGAAVEPGLTPLQRAECEEWQRAAVEQGHEAIEGERLWWRMRRGYVPEPLRDPFEDVLSDTTI